MSDEDYQADEVIDFILRRFPNAKVTIERTSHYGRKHRKYTIMFEEPMPLTEEDKLDFIPLFK